MPDTFVPMPALLRPVKKEAVEEVPEPVRDDEPREEIFEALSQIRRFRAAVADAAEVALATLLEDIAATVVARELQLASPDIAAIVRNAIARLEGEPIVRVRVHPDDAAALECIDLPVFSDARLRRGDVSIDVSSGTIDVSLGVRLETVLARC